MRLITLLLLTSWQLQGQPLEAIALDGARALSSYRYGEAIRAYHECHRQDEAYLPCLEGLAMAHLHSGNYRDARWYFNKVVDIDPDHVQARVSLANMDEQEGRHAVAAGHFSRLTELEPENAWFHKRLGRQRLAMNDADGATESFREALRLEARDLESMELLGQVLFQRERFDEVLDLTSSAIFQNDQYRPIWRLRLRSQQRLKDHAGALSSGLRLLALGDSSLNTLAATGYAALQSDSLDLALGLLDQACRMERAAELTHYHYSLALDRSGDRDGALVQVQEALRKGRSPFLSVFLDQESRLWEAGGRYTEAINALRSALDLADDPEKVFRIARLYDQWHRD